MTMAPSGRAALADGANIVVVGAGPVGLWAAWRAAEAGHRVTLLERAPRVGGMAASVSVAGMRVDLGSHRLHPSTPPAILARLRSLLGADLQVRPRRGRIRLGQAWVAFPLQAGDLLASVPPRFALGAAFDAATGALRSPRRDTFDEVVRAGLGPTIAREFYGPFARKLWGVGPEELAGDLARRRISARGASDIARRLVQGREPLGRTFLYPRLGFGQIADALFEAVRDGGVEVHLRAEVLRVDPGTSDRPARVGVRRASTDGPELSLFEADVVWSTVALPELARRVVPAPEPDLIERADRLQHRGLVLVYLVVETGQWTEFDAHYLPGQDQLAARISEPRNYRSSGDDPAGRTVLCAEVPASVGDRWWTASDEALAARLVSDLARLGLPSIDPVAVRVVRLPRVYPVLRPDTAWDLARLERWLEDHPRLVSFGRQGLFVPDNTHHGFLMAEAAAAALGADGTFDHDAWRTSLNSFRAHVVED